MPRINEYKQKPTLPDHVVTFIENYKGGMIPDDIRTDLEKYVKDITPFVNQAGVNLNNQFEKVFNK